MEIQVNPDYVKPGIMWEYGLALKAQKEQKEQVKKQKEEGKK